MTDDQSIHELETNGSKKYEVKPKHDRWIYVVAALVLLIAAGFLYWRSVQNEQEREAAQRLADKAGTQAQNGQNFAAQVLAACASEGAEGVLHQANLCGGAEEIVKEPVVGPAGPRGPQGPTGPQGPIGPRGPQGTAGADGATGTAGSDGAVGPSGQKGDKSDKGDRGEKGDPGPKGDPGAKGDPGVSAYPFSFTFTVPGSVGSPETTYIVTCSAPGSCAVQTS